MAIPTYTFSDNFESGDASGWDSETDTASMLDFPHYSELARVPGKPMPQSGAYCMRVELASNQTNAFVQEGDINMANGETWWFRFGLWIDPRLPSLSQSAAVDTIALFETQGAGNVVTFAFGVRWVQSTGLLHWAIGELSPTSWLTTHNVELGKWYTIELALLTDTDSTDGSITLYATKDGEEPSSTATHSLGSIQNIAATHGVLGVQDQDNDTGGVFLFDNFVMDNARIWPDKDRFAVTKVINESQHLFVGPGTVTGMTLASTGAADNVITVYDTDTAQTHAGLKKAILANGVAGEIVDAGNVPFEVTRGCYVEITGTDNPEVTMTIGRAPAWFSDGNMRRHAVLRNLHS